MSDKTTPNDGWFAELCTWADEFAIPEEELPREIGQLQQLARLDLRGNPLQSLPSSLQRLYRERDGGLTIYLNDEIPLDDAAQSHGSQ